MNIEDEMAIIRAIGKTRTPNFVIDDHNRAAFENIVNGVSAIHRPWR